MRPAPWAAPTMASVRARAGVLPVTATPGHGSREDLMVMDDHIRPALPDGLEARLPSAHHGVLRPPMSLRWSHAVRILISTSLQKRVAEERYNGLQIWKLCPQT